MIEQKGSIHKLHGLLAALDLVPIVSNHRYNSHVVRHQVTVMDVELSGMYSGAGVAYPVDAIIKMQQLCCV